MHFILGVIIELCTNFFICITLAILFVLQLIVSLNVDVIGFQEVRLEVGASARKQRKRSKNVQTQFQVSDLSRRLPDHQFVYQPAMLYMEKLLERKEEGLAIFSRYPILSADYRLLYRYLLKIPQMVV